MKSAWFPACVAVVAAVPALFGCTQEPGFATGAGSATDEPSTCARPAAVPEEVAALFDLKLGYYAKHCSVFGIDILASERVRDEVMEEAGRIVEGVFTDRKALRDAVHDRYFRVVLVASSAGEQLSDVPELAGITRVEDRAAGLGPDPAFPAATVRDSTIVCRPRQQDPLATPPGDTLVHELGHAVLDMGLSETDPGFRARLQDAYDRARREELWKLTRTPGTALFGDLPADNYLMSSPGEYWATGVSAWFGFKPIPVGYDLTDDDPPRLRLQVLYGRSALRERDAALAALLEEVLGADPELRTRCPAWIPSVSA